MKLIIGIVDTLTNELVGPLSLFKHIAPAVRMWDDVCKMENSSIRMHINDHALVQFGILNDETLQIELAEKTTIITGEQWLAMNNREEDK